MYMHLCGHVWRVHGLQVGLFFLFPGRHTIKVTQEFSWPGKNQVDISGNVVSCTFVCLYQIGTIIECDKYVISSYKLT